MRIIQIIDTLRAGGAERMAVNMAAAFSRNGIPNGLIVSRESGFQKNRVEEGTSYFQLAKRSFYDLRSFAKMLGVIRRFDPDVIHAHSTSIFWAVLARFFVRKIHVIWHDHYGLSDQLQKGDRKAERFFCKWVDGVVVVNERLRDWSMSDFGIESSRVVYIPNFPLLGRQISRRNQLGNPVVLLHISNFRRQKNHFMALEAFKILRQDYKIDAELWWVGNTLIEPNYYDEIIARTKETKLEDYIRFFGEIEEVEELLESADIGILSSDSEGLPVTLLEYALASLPVVVTDVGQIRMVLQNGKNGRLVAAGDVNSMALALRDVCEDYPAAQRMAHGAREHIEDRYGAACFLNEYISFVKSIR